MIKYQLDWKVKIMNIIENKTMDEERALYNLTDTQVIGCTFAGPADGESALKEARNIEVKDCSFSLRYPLWHTKNYKVTDTKMDELTRAALWYATDGEIWDSCLGGIKAVRECINTRLENCAVVSPEFGWKCDGLWVNKCDIESEYLFLDTKNIEFIESKMKGKYSFQYTENVTVENSYLDTKDAFWHSKNATVRDSVLKGEYLAWYSENLTLINCKIIGTQPLCYCKDLKLINCTMEDTDLSFEYSEVEAKVSGNIISVKNPKSGYIKADSIGEIILEDSVIDCNCEITCEN